MQEQARLTDESYQCVSESNRRELAEAFNNNMELTTSAAEIDERWLTMELSHN